MKLRFATAILFVIATLGISIGHYQVYTLQKQLKEANVYIKNLQLSIARAETRLQNEITDLDTKTYLAKKDHDTRFAIVQSNLDMINSTIDADKKRWARIRKVRDAIKQTLPESHPMQGCRKKPTPATIIQIATAVIDISDRYGVVPALTLGIIRRESAFCNEAISRAGARGLMQLMPATAADQVAEIGAPLKVYRIRDNIHLGVYYISKRLIDFEGNQDLALKAYNAGVNHVLKVKAGEIEDYYKEPREYAKAVLAFKKEYLAMGVQ